MSRRPAWIATGGLAAIAAHARTAWFAFTDLDDRDLVVDDHAFLADPANLLRAFGRSYMHVVDPGHAYYRPLVTVSYGLDAQWSGLRPAGYHVTNVALHAIACVLLALVLRRFVPTAIAVVAALVFAVHPALAAAVAWIPGRNDSLLAVFSLAAWLFFLRDGARRSRVDRALHFAALSFALLTKETAFVLPLVWMAQAMAVPWPRERRRDALEYVSGWAVLVAAAVGLHVALSGGGGMVSGGGGTVGLRTLLANLPQLFTSLGTIVFPFAPAVLATPADLSPWPGVLAALGLVAGSRLVPGVRPRLVAFGMITFVLTSLPVLAMPGTLVLDNRLYLPACGVLLALAEIVRAATLGRPEPVSPRVFAALSGVGVLFLVLLTIGYEPSFRDPRAFAGAAVEGAPHSALAHFCLGKAYQTGGEDDRALAEYETSLALGPGEVVHNNIAVIYMAHARWSDAERELREELAGNPRYARAYDNLAIVLRHEGRTEEAEVAMETARTLESE